MILHFKRLTKALPGLFRAYPTDAGTDLVAIEESTIEPGATALVPVNVAIALPPGYYAFVSGRSSLNARGILTHLGTIDQDFRGPISVAMTNLSKEPFEIKSGDRVAQLIVVPFARPTFREVDELNATERGSRGWGSTGRR